jgi:hypothetical protein
MPPREKPVVANMHFKTQTALAEYAKSRRDSIGITASVRSVSEKDIQFFYELLQRHPERERKLENFADFMICRNDIGSGLEMRVVRSDGLPPVSFSIPTCISGKWTGATQIIGAMRFAIVDQIIEFKRNASPECPRISPGCTGVATEADHVNHFEQLSHDFLKMHTPPKHFGKAIANQHCFLEEDKEFDDAWKEYHHANAVLRYLCGHCNKTRPKWEGYV